MAADHSVEVTGSGEPTGNAVTRFRQGFVAILPLWAGAIPFGIAYGVTAREAGLSALAVQLMSLTVFSAAAQISAVSLLQVGASSIEVLITVLVLNIHLPLIGAAITRAISFTAISRLVSAWLLTDASYAVTIAQGPLRLATLLGAGVSMYLGWNLGTALGLVAGGVIPDPRQLAIDFVVPLTFLAVLVPLIRTRIALLVVMISALMTLLLAMWLPIGVAILSAGLSASILGARLTAPKAAIAKGANSA